MRVLHLFANWKWTGPAEPAVNLAATLKKRGHDVHFACGREVKPLPNYVANEARSRGLEPILSMRLGKHRHPIYDPIDRRTLRSLLQALRPEIIHCHLPNDHRLALGAARGSGIPVVRSLYDGETPRVNRDTRTLFGKSARGVITVSDRVRDGLLQKFAVSKDRCIALDGAVDLRRFNPSRKRVQDLRADYGLEKGDFVVGIVARMQRHRRFEILFEAVSKAAEELGNLKLLLVGRGTWMEEVAVKPAATKELAGKVIFTGYRHGAEYVATLKCMDVKVYLTPGSDGSCRAVREALAMGVPVVAARRGHLVDLVEEGVTGLHVDDDADQLADALIGLGRDRKRLAAMSEAAQKHAHRQFGLPAQAKRVEQFYERVLAG
jgi:glycosyltransferase involved in cell wall biosynthesis